MPKVIFLVDMNAFFISCEMTRIPSLIGKPAAVAGDPKKRSGIILAANYEARAYGVKTAMVLHKALKLCPNMLLVPSDHHFYQLKSKQVMSLLSDYTPIIEQNSIDEAWLDMTGTEALFGKPVEAAEKIMDEIKNKLGLWCSIGISENKFLAKMASEMKKPLGITELWKHDVPLKLWHLPINKMYGIGSKTAEILHNLGIQTIGDFAQYDKKIIPKKLGKVGVELHQKANGVDSSQLLSRSDDDIKSIGRSITLPNDLSDINKAKLVIMKLSDEVSATARKNNKQGRTVQITIKYSDFKIITRQMTIPKTYLTKRISRAGMELLNNNWNPRRSIRLLGISLSGFDEECEMEQISLFDMPQLNMDLSSDKEEKLDKTIDSIRNKYGDDTISWGALGIIKKIPNQF